MGWLKDCPSELIGDEAQFIQDSQKFADSKVVRDWRKLIQSQYQKWLHLSENAPRKLRNASLLSGDLLNAGVHWLQTRPGDLIRQESDYIDLSLNKRNQLLGRQRKLKYAGSVSVILLILLGAFQYWRWTNNASWDLALTAVGMRFGLKPEGMPFPKMKLINAGVFQMGSSDEDIKNGNADAHEAPQHTVHFDKPFYMGINEIQFSEYAVFVSQINSRDYQCKTPDPINEPDLDPRGFGLGEQPAINVSWYHASCYAEWLSFLTGDNYHLPTEAQWEYAARAGTASLYYWGDDKNKAAENAWFAGNSHAKPHPVNERLNANPWGLANMAGNVWERVADCNHHNYDKAPADGRKWESEDNGYCDMRMLRGGSWRRAG